MVIFWGDDLRDRSVPYSSEVVTAQVGVVTEARIPNKTLLRLIQWAVFLSDFEFRGLGRFFSLHWFRRLLRS